MKFFLVCFLLIGATCANTDISASKKLVSADLNDYIDKILPNIVQFLIDNGLDPMGLPDLRESFSVKPILITYHGELSLTKGILNNLRSLRRSGDIKVAYQSKIIVISGDFGIDNIRFDYDYLAKIMNIGPTGGVKGSLSRGSFFFEILIDFNSNELHLQNFYLHSVGSINVSLSGNILVDWLSNSIIKVITTLFKGTILNIVESRMKGALQDYIDQINNSMGGTKMYLDSMRAVYEAPQLHAANNLIF